MSTTLVHKLGLLACLLGARLPRASTSPPQNVDTDPAGDEKRVLADGALNNAGCSVDTTGNYTSEYGVLLRITQTDCSLFVDPPGKVVGLLMGRSLNIAGQAGQIVGTGTTVNKIHFINGAVWTKRMVEGLPAGTTTTLEAKAEASSVLQASADPCNTAIGAGTAKQTDHSAITASHPVAVSPPSMPVAVKATTTFPWWAVGTGIAIAGVGAIAGGVAAGVTQNQATTAQRPTAQTEAPAASLRFMAPTASAESSEGGGSQQFLSNGGALGSKKAELTRATPQPGSVGPMTQAAATAAPRFYLLGGLALLACCFILMLVGGGIGLRSWRSSKTSRVLRVAKARSQHSSESEDASDEEDDEEEEVTEMPLLRVVPEGN